MWVLGVDAAAVVVGVLGLAMVGRGLYRRGRSLLHAVGELPDAPVKPGR